MKKVLCIALCLMIIMSNFTAVFAIENDYDISWAKNEIKYMKNRGVVSGYPDGSFKPDNNMSKAEFYKVINRIMGFTSKSEISFSDVTTDNWYYNEVAKGVAAGYIIPAKLLEADSKITRAEVARIISVVFSVEGDEKETEKFTDYGIIPDNLKAIIGGLKKNGFINGYPDGSFRFDAKITRAEVVKMLHNIVGEIVNEKGIVSNNVDKSLVVNITDVSLKEMQVGGNLYLTEGIGEGSVSLDKVIVKNTTIINGGGANSVNINNSELKSLLLNKRANLLNVVLSNTKADAVSNSNQTKLELREASQIKNLELKDKAELILDKNSIIDKLIISGSEVSINAKGSIKYIKSDSKFKINGIQANANIEYKFVDEKLTLLNPSGGETGGNNGGNPVPVAEYTVTFKLAGGTINGKTDDVIVKVKEKTTLAKPTDPIKANYNFEGWYENTSGQKFDFATVITKNIVLTAKWTLKQVDPEDPKPTVIVKYEPTSITNFPFIHVEVQNLDAAAKYSIEYFIIGENDETKLVDSPIFNINEKSGAIYYDKNKFDTINVKIYNQNEELIYTFEDIIPALYGEAPPSVDKSKLNAAISLAIAKNENDYTPESWSVFAQALEAAKAINNKSTASQAEVDAALSNLNVAMLALVVKSTDPIPALSAKFYPGFISTFGQVEIDSLINLSQAAKFIVEYHLSPNDDGSENIKRTSLTPIADRTTDLVFYYPSSTNYNTIKILIYDANDSLIYTFENIVPIIVSE